MSGKVSTIASVIEKEKETVGMRMSDAIAEFINSCLTTQDVLEMKRSELAERFGCAPSQINYVITTRFSPENGYIVESRRGGGGYLRIRRVVGNRKALIMHAVSSIGSEIDAASAGAILSNLHSAGAVGTESARLIATALGEQALRNVPPELRAAVRAELLKRMLMVCESV